LYRIYNETQSNITRIKDEEKEMVRGKERKGIKRKEKEEIINEIIYLYKKRHYIKRNKETKVLHDDGSRSS